MQWNEFQRPAPQLMAPYDTLLTAFRYPAYSPTFRNAAASCTAV